MNNLILQNSCLPPFSKITYKDFIPAININLKKYKETIEKILKKNSEFTWENLCRPLEKKENSLHYTWSTIRHLNNVKDDFKFRKNYMKCIALLSEFNAWILQNKRLYQAYKSIKENNLKFNSLDEAKKKSINNKIKDFELSGVNLSSEKRKKYKEIILNISKLSSKFNNNILDSTIFWKKLITEEKYLQGIPEYIISKMQKLARSENKKGWLMNLDPSIYTAVIKYAENQDIRKEIYIAYNTRGSCKKWDNSKIVKEIIDLRYKLSKLLNFENFAEYSLQNKMAKSTRTVLNFLEEIRSKTYDKAKKEYFNLKKFSEKYFKNFNLEPWDLAFYSEKEKQHRFFINEEEIRSYFPEKQVLKGLFKIVKKLFNIRIKEKFDIDVWDSDVRFFEIYNAKNALYGGFYLDLYAKEKKQEGAWMDVCKGKMKLKDNILQTPVAYLICNFNKSVNNCGCLLKHQEVVTLFHEFGHVLHHLLTKIDVLDISGVQGVLWDAIEIPSQTMENWCWEKEVLLLISKNYKTGKKLPIKIIEDLINSRKYQTAIFILRQLELGFFDFLIHSNLSNIKDPVSKTLKYVKKQVCIIPSLSNWNYFPYSFSHIFSGGYAAGYYSYLWSNVLASDIFSKFLKDGIFNEKTGKSFLDNFLSMGAIKNPMNLFKKFRKRKPNVNIMLRQYGIQ